MRNRGLFSVATIAAVGSIAVAGCGGGDDTSTTATTGASGATGTAEPLTTDQWVTQADAICAQGDKQQQTAIKDFFQQQGIPTDQQPSDAQLEQLATDVLIPNIEQQIDSIKALPVPEDDADRVNAFVDQADSDLSALQDDPSQITDGNANPFAETQTLAKDLGLKNCASG
jgi:hypothetical protein